MDDAEITDGLKALGDAWREAGDEPALARRALENKALALLRVFAHRESAEEAVQALRRAGDWLIPTLLDRALDTLGIADPLAEVEPGMFKETSELTDAERQRARELADDQAKVAAEIQSLLDQAADRGIDVRDCAEARRADPTNPATLILLRNELRERLAATD